MIPREREGRSAIVAYEDVARHFMKRWEEDPKWQQANYRFLVGMAAVGVTGVLLGSIWSGNWHPFRVVLGVLGVLAAAICLYAALVSVAGFLARKAWSGLKNLGRKKDDA